MSHDSRDLVAAMLLFMLYHSLCKLGTKLALRVKLGSDVCDAVPVSAPPRRVSNSMQRMKNGGGLP